MDDGSDFRDGTALNVQLNNSRYPALPCSSGARDTNRASMWLVQSRTGEPNLEPLTINDAGNIAASHTLVTPRGMRLVLTQEDPDFYAPPTTTFNCEDINDDGKIDRVTISLELAEYDEGGADVRNGNVNDQRMRFPKVVDLPNVK
jgi:hypothetical protein